MRLSDPLKHDAIAAGYIQPWARDNAKRKPDRKGYRLRSSGPLARAPRESGQLLLFPEFSKPVALAGNRINSETIGVIAFDDLFDQLVLTARRIIAEQQIAVHRRDTEHYDAVTRELQGLEQPSKPIPEPP